MSISDLEFEYLRSVTVGDTGNMSLNDLRRTFYAQQIGGGSGGGTSAPKVGVSAKEFGATGDGTTADGAKINQAIASALSFGVPLIVPNGTYKMDQAVVLGSGAKIQMAPNAMLDFSNLNTGSLTTLISAAGTTEAPVALTENTIVGTKVVVVSDGSKFAAGDDVRLASTTKYDTSSTNIPIAEILVVEEVVGNTVTLTTPIIGGPYLVSASANLRKINFVNNIYIEGGTVKGGPIGANQHGLDFQWGKQIKLIDVAVLSVDRVQATFNNCIDSHIQRGYFRNAIAQTTAYGVSFNNSCQDCSCTDSTFIDVRHSLSTNNASDVNVAGISRRILFQSNFVRDSSVALGGSMLGGDAIDTHTAAEDIYILDNVVYASSGQGINFECRSGRVERNKVHYAVSTGISVHPEGDYQAWVTVKDNVVYYAGGNGYAINTGTRGSLATFDYLCVMGNSAVECEGTGFQIRGINAYMENLIYSNNQSINCKGAGEVFNFMKVKNALITTNQGRSAVAGVKGYRFRDCDNIFLATNMMVLSGTNTDAVHFGDDVTNSTVGVNSLIGTRKVTLGAGAGNVDIGAATSMVNIPWTDITPLLDPAVWTAGTGTTQPMYRVINNVYYFKGRITPVVAFAVNTVYNGIFTIPGLGSLGSLYQIPAAGHTQARMGTSTVSTAGVYGYISGGSVSNYIDLSSLSGALTL